MEAPTPVAAPTPAEPKDLPRPKERTLNEDTLRKAFRPEAVVAGAGGRKCSVWPDKVVVTRPAAKSGEWEIKIKPRNLDIDTDCQWEGDVLVESAGVGGEAIGAVWPYLVLHGPGPTGAGPLQIVHTATGGVTAQVAEAMSPNYTRSLVVGFTSMIRPEIPGDESVTCDQRVAKAWADTLASLEAAKRVSPNLDRATPRCEPRAYETCKFVFVLPYELVLSQREARPAAGTVGCLAAVE